MTTIERPYKILIVDDEPDVVSLFTQRIRRDVLSGRYELEFASSGRDALDLLSRVPDVDLVITDINMPDMDGLTLLEQIPQVQSNLRSVILSAYGDMHSIRTAMNCGAYDFVTKPVDFQDLRDTIERTLRRLQEWRDAVAARDQLVSLQRDLDIASRMQRDILPKTFPSDALCSVHASMVPARTVAGDFYDVIRLPDGRLVLLIADVSGKGVPAAMLMMSARTLLRGAVIGVDDPGQVLAEVNSVLCQHNPMLMFVTVLFCVYDPSSGVLAYANAGHTPAALVSADGVVSELPGATGLALGLVAGRRYPSFRWDVPHGSLVFLYTDGVTEAIAPDGSWFGQARLFDLLAACAALPPDEAIDAVVDAVQDFSGPGHSFDDLTCLALARHGLPSSCR